MFFKKNKELSIFKDAVFAVSGLAKADKDQVLLMLLLVHYVAKMARLPVLRVSTNVMTN